MIKNNVATLILSCDNYSDLWKGFIYQFKKYYNIDNKVYFSSNTFQIGDIFHDFTLIETGPETSWSDNLIKILKLIDEEYLIITLEDLYLSKPCNLMLYKRLENIVNKLDVNHIKLTDYYSNINPLDLDRVPEGEWGEEGELREIGSNSPYRVTLCGLWRKNTLLKLLMPGETPWQFEINGTERSKRLNGFYCVANPVIFNVNMVEKGYWEKAGVKWAIKNQIPIDESTRKYKPTCLEIKSQFNKYYFKFMMSIRIKHRLAVYEFFKKILILH